MFINTSIIIPVYNEGNFILACLNSLKNQTIKNFEVIIVDNNSKDETIELINRNKARYSFEIKIIKCRTQGISYARNEGAKYSNRKYLAFFDADGTIIPNWVESALDEINKQKKTEVIGGFNLFCASNLSKKILYNSYVYFLYFYILAIEKLFHKTLFIPGNNMLINKELFLNLGGFPHIVGEDLEFTKKLNKYKTIKNFKIKTKTNMKIHYSSRRFDKKGFFKSIFNWIKDNIHKKDSKYYDVYR